MAVDLAPRHAFYDWCNEVLAEAEFDEAVEIGRASCRERVYSNV